MDSNHKKVRAALDLSFRHHYARVMAQLLARFGANNLDIIEESLLTTLSKAMETWPYQGIPDNPGAWLTTTAGNEVIDTLRREKSWTEKVSDLEMFKLDDFNEVEYQADIEPELRLMFLCCLPEIEAKDQIILILKFLCGFDNELIAFVFLSSESAIDKRISRSRKLMSNKELPELKPTVVEFTTPVVKRALYLLFNEGYHSGVSEKVVKTEVCDEAIRLTMLLLNVLNNDMSAYALLALMYLHRSRLSSKVDEAGDLILLQDQDRLLWNQDMIHNGLELWQHSLKGWQVSQYHIEAGIAAQHCMAKSIDNTNWQSIVDLYDLLIKIKPSAMVVLNRLIAKSQIHIDQKLLHETLSLTKDKNIRNYPYLYCFLGDLNFQLGDIEASKSHYKHAIPLCLNISDRKVVEDKLAALVASI